MIETVPAQLRYVCTLAFGARLHTRSLDRLVTALLDAREEFGAVGRDAGHSDVRLLLARRARGRDLARRHRSPPGTPSRAGGRHPALGQLTRPVPDHARRADRRTDRSRLVPDGLRRPRTRARTARRAALA